MILSLALKASPSGIFSSTCIPVSVSPEMRRLLALAVRVNCSASSPMRVCCAAVASGKEGLEAARLVVARVVADAESAASGECPGDVEAAGEDSKSMAVVHRRARPACYREDRGVDKTGTFDV